MVMAEPRTQLARCFHAPHAVAAIHTHQITTARSRLSRLPSGSPADAKNPTTTFQSSQAPPTTSSSSTIRSATHPARVGR
ncbi:hypothetical protein D3226_05125 [Leucobacter chromiireducens subsp. chromiireducens]|uniref:Uncharacterized protein n=1 Tax=Leucobacter chromiireducens subsp. chromiireducens TaxID=660067 RepID=A0ABS1SME1_9MICO|nr:hypothetical protein [Leucobacter chromiireducens subsp. chromiireducens]